MDWLDSKDAKNTHEVNCQSQMYWKNFPKSWEVLQSGIVVSAKTTFESPVSSPPTEETISRSISNTSLDNILLMDDHIKDQEMAREAVLEATQQNKRGDNIVINTNGTDIVTYFRRSRNMAS